MELSPSDQTLAIVARVRKHLSAEFIPLSRATSLADNKDVHVDHIRVKGANGDLLLGPSKSLSRRNSDFNKNIDAFLFAVKFLMRTYVLVSCADEGNPVWLPLQSAISHITAVENFPRACARNGSGFRPQNFRSRDDRAQRMAPGCNGRAHTPLTRDNRAGKSPLLYLAVSP